MQSVSTFFKKERDFLYRQGEQKGFEKAQAKAELEKKEIARLTAAGLKNKNMVIADIIEITGLSKEEIEAL